MVCVCMHKAVFAERLQVTTTEWCLIRSVISSHHTCRHCMTVLVFRTRLLKETLLVAFKTLNVWLFAGLYETFYINIVTAAAKEKKPQTLCKKKKK